MKAIIIGAGRGRRLMPTTADTPKCFAAVRDRPILDWILDALAANGVTRVCFIGGYQIESFFSTYGGRTAEVPASEIVQISEPNLDWSNNGRFYGSPRIVLPMVRKR